MANEGSDEWYALRDWYRSTYGRRSGHPGGGRAARRRGEARKRRDLWLGRTRSRLMRDLCAWFSGVLGEIDRSTATASPYLFLRVPLVTLPPVYRFTVNL